jgi:hypothetical protein
MGSPPGSSRLPSALHSDVDVNLALEYALTRVNFREPANSRLVYRLSIERHNCSLIDTSDPDFALWYGGSDDDLAFAGNKLDLNGRPIGGYASLAEMVHRLKPDVTPDEKFARLVWARVLKGNAEGAADGESLPPDIDGFSGTRKIGPNGQEYIEPASLFYALRAMLDLPADATRAQLLDAMKDIIVGKAAYVGRFRQ